MAQARRKRQARANPRRGAGKATLASAFSAIKQGIGFFITGALSGVLALMFWQGYQSADQDDMGSGIKEMVAQSRLQAQKRAAEAERPEPILVDNTPRVKPQYDFYTVLPEIEEVLPKDKPILSPPVASVKTKTKNAKVTAISPLKAGSSYMLQVASYAKKDDAERLKAKLALGGMRSSIQKVSIDRKNYFRVRIGPYANYGSMTSDDSKLSKMGFKAMRLRLSKAG